MNRIYRVIFNQTTKVWQAVSEISKTSGKAKSQASSEAGRTVKGVSFTLKLLGLASVLAAAQAANAVTYLPMGHHAEDYVPASVVGNGGYYADKPHYVYYPAGSNTAQPVDGGYNQPAISGGFNQPTISGGYNQPSTSGGSTSQPVINGGSNTPVAGGNTSTSNTAPSQTTPKINFGNVSDWLAGKPSIGIPTKNGGEVKLGANFNDGSNSLGYSKDGTGFDLTSNHQGKGSLTGDFSGNKVTVGADVNKGNATLGYDNKGNGVSFTNGVDGSGSVTGSVFGNKVTLDNEGKVSADFSNLNPLKPGTDANKLVIDSIVNAGKNNQANSAQGNTQANTGFISFAADANPQLVNTEPASNGTLVPAAANVNQPATSTIASNPAPVNVAPANNSTLVPAASNGSQVLSPSEAAEFASRVNTVTSAPAQPASGVELGSVSDVLNGKPNITIPTEQGGSVKLSFDLNKGSGTVGFSQNGSGVELNGDVHGQGSLTGDISGNKVTVGADLAKGNASIGYDKNGNGVTITNGVDGSGSITGKFLGNSVTVDNTGKVSADLSHLNPDEPGAFSNTVVIGGITSALGGKPEAKLPINGDADNGTFNVAANPKEGTSTLGYDQHGNGVDLVSGTDGSNNINAHYGGNTINIGSNGALSVETSDGQKYGFSTQKDKDGNPIGGQPNPLDTIKKGGLGGIVKLGHDTVNGVLGLTKIAGEPVPDMVAPGAPDPNDPGSVVTGAFTPGPIPIPTFKPGNAEGAQTAQNAAQANSDAAQSASQYAPNSSVSGQPSDTGATVAKPSYVAGTGPVPSSPVGGQPLSPTIVGPQFYQGTGYSSYSMPDEVDYGTPTINMMSADVPEVSNYALFGLLPDRNTSRASQPAPTSQPTNPKFPPFTEQPQPMVLNALPVDPGKAMQPQYNDVVFLGDANDLKGGELRYHRYPGAPRNQTATGEWQLFDPRYKDDTHDGWVEVKWRDGFGYFVAGRDNEQYCGSATDFNGCSTPYYLWPQSENAEGLESFTNTVNGQLPVTIDKDNNNLNINARDGLLIGRDTDNQSVYLGVNVDNQTIKLNDKGQLTAVVSGSPEGNGQITTGTGGRSPKNQNGFTNFVATSESTTSYPGFADVETYTYEGVNEMDAIRNDILDIKESGFGLTDQDGNTVQKEMGTPDEPASIAIIGDENKNISTKVVDQEDGSQALSVQLNNDLHLIDGDEKSEWNATGIGFADGKGNNTAVAANTVALGDEDSNKSVFTSRGVGVEDNEGNASALTSKEIILESKDGNGAELTQAGIAFKPAQGDAVTLSVNGLNNAGNKVVNVAEGDLSADSTDAVNGGQLFTTNERVDQLAEDMKKGPALAAKGLNFVGDSGDEFNSQLGTTVSITGGVKEPEQLTSGNIGVVSDGKSNLQVGLAKNLSGLESVQTGATTVSNAGVVIQSPVQGNSSNVVSLTASGLDNGGNRITNVAPAVNGTDAVNLDQINAMNQSWSNQLNTMNQNWGSQLNRVNNELHGDINKVDNNARAGIAGALAAASLREASTPNEKTVAIAGGTYRGEAGYAMSISTMSPNGHYAIKAVATGDSRSNFGASAGASYSWW